MFSLELRNTLPPPPGLSPSIADTTYLFSSLSMQDLSNTDLEYLKAKETPPECLVCSSLLKLCDKLFTSKQKVLACLVDTFNLVQKESICRVKIEKERDDARNEKNVTEELAGPYRKIRALLVEVKKKEKIVSDLLMENKELTRNRIFLEKLVSQVQKELIAKNEALADLEKKERVCLECIEKDGEVKAKALTVLELQEAVQGFSAKMNEVYRVAAEKEILTQKVLAFAEILSILPEVNGRELRMSIHRQICEIETDFIELPPTQQNFENLKDKFLQLPYLLKPIFDLTKQFEKTIVELRKIIFS